MYKKVTLEQYGPLNATTWHNIILKKTWAPSVAECHQGHNSSRKFVVAHMLAPVLVLRQ